jgi:hypothetical protein
MNGTTDQPAVPQPSRWNLKWILMFIIAGFMVIFMLSTARRMFHGHGTDVMPPHIAVGGLIVKQGIEEFQNGRPATIPVSTAMHIFLSVLITYVVAPTVIIFYLLRARWFTVEGRPAVNVGVKDGVHSFVFLISLILVAIVVLDTAAGAFGSSSSFTRAKGESDVSYQREMLSKDLVMAYIDLMQYYYQTERVGGTMPNIAGAGSATPVRSPGDLGMKAKSEFGALYLSPVSSDSLILVTAVGTVKGGGVHFRNADGDSGKIQCCIIIRPYTHKYEIQQAN